MFCLIFLCYGGLGWAQETSLSSGGNVSGSGGNVSYSIGQTVYTVLSGTNGSVTQGVQQPYEISVVLGVENTHIELEISAYPNPTSGDLTLQLGNADVSLLQFQLFDLNGKLIHSQKIANSTERVSMNDLPNAVYFLKVNDNKNTLKSFKIIKTK